ncbi:hypothetical protein F4777DRAFT_580909 [Nemania sp. FL0916]|nr:hypothetical protein F4777DRAFT_580909 [Nemania sp. FL0916]
MEHLSHSSDPSRLIVIPYIDAREFEASCSRDKDALYNFKAYLERNGWNFHSRTGELSFDNKSSEDIVKSLQTSLFFGCLVSVFSRVGINVGTRDFIATCPTQRGQFLSTAKLTGLVAQWIQREGFADVSTDGRTSIAVNDPKSQRGENVMEMLNWTHFFLGQFCQRIADMGEPHKELMKLTELCIMAMGESLCSVIAEIYGYESRSMPVWGPAPILRARLLENKWCGSDFPFFPESMSRAATSASYYFGSIPCPRPRGDHSTCTSTICREYLQVIEPGTYIQRHVRPLCSCLQVIVDSAADVVLKGEIPVLQWDGENVRVSTKSSHSRYVVISHVWSDGLGNDDKTNSLAICQLSRIQSLVNRLYSQTQSHLTANPTELSETRSEMIPFWIDTLCVPVGQAAEAKRLRTRAIRQMAEIYREADRVLVLDSYIQTLSRSADIVAKYMHIHLSTWHHRLWTMQEGQLARNLMFQFSDGSESFDDMKRAEAQRLDPRTPENLCSPIRLLCSTELDKFYRSFEPEGAEGRDIETKIRSCANYLRSRQTSRLEDESVCVATILGLDPREILEQKDPEKRMASFYDLVGRFDARIIFNEHPRLTSDGYRWAPKSFLHQLPDLITETERFSYQHGPAALIPRGGGLPVQFGGFEFSVPMPLLSGTSTIVKPFPGGLYNFPPQTFGSTKPPWWACTYNLEISEAPVNYTPSERATSRYAVIFPQSLHPDQLPAPGILGAIDPFTPQDPRIRGDASWNIWTTADTPPMQLPAYSSQHRITVRHICRVHVSMVAAETVSNNLPFIWCWAYSEKQEWCIK